MCEEAGNEERQVRCLCEEKPVGAGFFSMPSLSQHAVSVTPCGLASSVML